MFRFEEHTYQTFESAVAAREAYIARGAGVSYIVQDGPVYRFDSF